MSLINHTFRILTVILFTAPLCAYADSWSCSRGNDVREIHIDLYHAMLFTRNKRRVLKTRCSGVQIMMTVSVMRKRKTLLPNLSLLDGFAQRPSMKKKVLLQRQNYNKSDRVRVPLFSGPAYSLFFHQLKKPWSAPIIFFTTNPLNFRRYEISRSGCITTQTH